MAEVICARNLQKRFGRKTVLENVELAVARGEILGLLGPSGSGKTTLVKLLIGMGIPDSGRVEVLGKEMPHLQTVAQIGYMAQSDALYEDLSGYDNLLFFGALYGWRGHKAVDRARQVLELVALTADAHRPIKDFSGGMKRRLSLAIALFHQPQILILDEPTVGIDPLLRRQFWQEFGELKSQGTTILITTHAMYEAEQCDRLALIRDGGIIACGSPRELKERAGTGNINDAFLFFGRKQIEIPRRS